MVELEFPTIDSGIAAVERHRVRSQEATAGPACCLQARTVQGNTMPQKNNHSQREITLQEQHSSETKEITARSQRDHRSASHDRHSQRGEAR